VHGLLCTEYTASLFSMVDYAGHVSLGKNEPSLDSKAHGPLRTLVRWSVNFPAWTWLILSFMYT